MKKGQSLVTTSDESLWKVKDVAAFTRFSRSWVYKRIASGRIPYIEVGGHPRFIPADIRAWVAAGSQG